MALHNGGASEEPTESIALRPGESGVVEIDGTPFVVQGAGEGRLAARDVAPALYAAAVDPAEMAAGSSAFDSGVRVEPRIR